MVATFIVAQAATLLGVVSVITALKAVRDNSEGLGTMAAISGIACLIAVVAAASLAYHPI